MFSINIAWTDKKSFQILLHVEISKTGLGFRILILPKCNYRCSMLSTDFSKNWAPNFIQNTDILITLENASVSIFREINE